MTGKISVCNYGGMPRLENVLVLLPSEPFRATTRWYRLSDPPLPPDNGTHPDIAAGTRLLCMPKVVTVSFWRPSWQPDEHMCELATISLSPGTDHDTWWAAQGNEVVETMCQLLGWDMSDDDLAASVSVSVNLLPKTFFGDEYAKALSTPEESESSEAPYDRK